MGAGNTHADGFVGSPRGAAQYCKNLSAVTLGNVQVETDAANAAGTSNCALMDTSDDNSRSQILSDTTLGENFNIMTEVKAPSGVSEHVAPGAMDTGVPPNNSEGRSNQHLWAGRMVHAWEWACASLAPPNDYHIMI